MKVRTYLLLISFSVLMIAGCKTKPNADIPETERDTVTNNYFGTNVSDPYRWLEDETSPKVKQWIDEQNKYTDKVISSFTEGKNLEKRIEELSITSVEQFSPEIINSKLFFSQFTPPQAQPVVAYKDWPDGKIEVLIDPNKNQNTAVTGFWVSPKGNYVAYGTAVGGSEATTIQIVNVKTGKDLADVLPNAGGGTTAAGLIWDPDEKGFSYVHLPAPGTILVSELQFNAAIYHHTLGDSQSKDKLVFGKDLSQVAEYTFIPSKGAAHAAMFVHFGDGNPSSVYLRNGNSQWKEVLDTKANVRVASEVNTGATWDGDNLLVISYEESSNGKLLSISPDGNTKVILQSDDWAMNAVAPIKGGFLITKVLGPNWKIDQYDIQGKYIRTVNLSQTGIGIGAIASSSESEQALITYSGWTVPEKWAQYNSTNGDLKTISEVKPAADYSKVKAQVIEAISKDGTKIPVTILSMDNVTPNRKRPAIVYGYGGFDIPTAPRFIGAYLAWLENGGVFAYANIRGGCEFGESWHRNGMLDKKQNVFDDMYAAAESLIKNNWTDSKHLGIMGGSNGGLLMGAELTQHPESFKAVVSFVGIYDMIRNELFPNGQYNISEYGTSTIESDFNWMYEYSPYHHVKGNTSYPAILLETAVNDPRVAPWQSRKFAAALQAANNSDNPILLLTRMNEGHGVTSTFSQRVGNTAAALSFFAHELGLEVKE